MALSSRKITYTNDFKLRVLDYYFKHGGDENFGLKKKTAQHFNIDKKTISRMLQNPDMVKRARRLVSRRVASPRPATNQPKTRTLARPETSRPAGSSQGSGGAGRTQVQTKTRQQQQCVENEDDDVPVIELPEDPDYSVLKRSIDSSNNGVASIAKLLVTATKEVQNLLLNECDVILECKVCRNLFRSLVNFLAHKRIYCQEEYVEVKSLFRKDNTHGITSQSQTVIVEPEPPPDDPPSSLLPPSTSSSLLPPSASSSSSLTARSIDNIARRLAGRKGVDTSSSTYTGSSEYHDGLLRTTTTRSSMSRDCSVVLEDIRGVSTAVYQTFVPPDASQPHSIRAMVEEVREHETGVTVAVGESGKVVKTAPGNVSSMEVENVTQDSPRENVCRICNTRFATQKTLNVHQRTQHGFERSVFTCPICLATFLNMLSVVKHLQKIHKKTKTQVERLRKVIKKNVYKKVMYQGDEAKRQPKEEEEEEDDDEEEEEDQEEDQEEEEEGEQEAMEVDGPGVLKTGILASPTKTPTKSPIKMTPDIIPESPSIRDETPEKKIAIQIRRDYNKAEESPFKVPRLPRELRSDEEDDEPRRTRERPRERPREEQRKPNLFPRAQPRSEDDPSTNSKVEALLLKICRLDILKCIPCQRRFQSITTLKRHASQHLDWTRFTCNLCGFRSYNRYTNIQHCTSRHSATKEQLDNMIRHDEVLGQNIIQGKLSSRPISPASDRPISPASDMSEDVEDREVKEEVSEVKEEVREGDKRENKEENKREHKDKQGSKEENKNNITKPESKEENQENREEEIPAKTLNSAHQNSAHQTLTEILDVNDNDDGFDGFPEEPEKINKVEVMKNEEKDGRKEGENGKKEEKDGNKEKLNEEKDRRKEEVKIEEDGGKKEDDGRKDKNKYKEEKKDEEKKEDERRDEKNKKNDEEKHDNTKTKNELKKENSPKNQEKNKTAENQANSNAKESPRKPVIKKENQENDKNKEKEKRRDEEKNIDKSETSTKKSENYTKKSEHNTKNSETCTEKSETNLQKSVTIFKPPKKVKEEKNDVKSEGNERERRDEEKEKDERRNRRERTDNEEKLQNGSEIKREREEGKTDKRREREREKDEKRDRENEDQNIKTERKEKKSEERKTEERRENERKDKERKTNKTETRKVIKQENNESHIKPPQDRRDSTDASHKKSDLKPPQDRRDSTDLSHKKPDLKPSLDTGSGDEGRPQRQRKSIEQKDFIYESKRSKDGESSRRSSTPKLDKEERIKREEEERKEDKKRKRSLTFKCENVAKKRLIDSPEILSKTPSFSNGESYSRISQEDKNRLQPKEEKSRRVSSEGKEREEKPRIPQSPGKEEKSSQQTRELSKTPEKDAGPFKMSVLSDCKKLSSPVKVSVTRLVDVRPVRILTCQDSEDSRPKQQQETRITPIKDLAMKPTKASVKDYSSSNIKTKDRSPTKTNPGHLLKIKSLSFVCDGKNKIISKVENGEFNPVDARKKDKAEGMNDRKKERERLLGSFHEVLKRRKEEEKKVDEKEVKIESKEKQDKVSDGVKEQKTLDFTKESLNK